MSKFTAHFRRQARMSRRDLPDGMLDPFSVLGFLSFATFLFSILYHRYKDKNGNKSTPSLPGVGSAQLSNGHNPQNMEYLVKMAAKILNTVSALEDTYLDEDGNGEQSAGNSTGNQMDDLEDSIDYYEAADSSGLRRRI